MALDPTTIAVATIAAAGAIGSAWVNRQRHHEVREIRQTLGSQNGQGNVVELLEFLKQWVLLHEMRHTYGDKQSPE